MSNGNGNGNGKPSLHLQARRNRQRMEAVKYAAAMRSDPFAFNRCVTHINMGICDPDSKGRDMHYTAEEHQETRRLPPSEEYPEGEQYTATVHKNVIST